MSNDEPFVADDANCEIARITARGCNRCSGIGITAARIENARRNIPRILSIDRRRRSNERNELGECSKHNFNLKCEWKNITYDEAVETISINNFDIVKKIQAILKENST